MDPREEASKLPSAPADGAPAAEAVAAEAPAAEAPAAAGWWQAVRAAMSGEQHEYTSGSLNRAILLLAVPMVLEMAMESVFAVVDVFFVAKLGADAVATVGLTESVLTLLYAVAFGLGMATTAVVARRIGQRDPQGAARSAAQGIILGLAVSVVVGVPAWLCAPDILTLMGASAKTIAVGSGYTRILLGTNAVIMLLFVNNAVFRGAGDAVIAMRALWIANGINLVLDPCLIFGLGPFPELGVTGAAVATACGRGVGVAYQFWALGRGAGRIRIDRATWRLDFVAMRNLARVSIGGIGQLLVATASWVVLMRIMAPFGSEALAGYAIAVRIILFALLPSWGLANAAATLVGQNLGAGRPDRAERSVWLTGTYNMIFLGAVAVVFISVPDALVGLFTGDAAIATVGAEALRVISYGYVFYAWGMVMMQAFNGAGDTLTPTWANVICFWACQIPLAFVLARVVQVGPAGVFWSVTVAESLLAVLTVVLFKRGRWKHKVV